MGSLQILNVGAGDIKLSFSKDNPAETIRANRIVKDMLRRGYALLVEVERDGVKAFERAVDFNEEHGEYIIADFDPAEAREHDLDEAAGVIRHQRRAIESLEKDKEPENGPASENEAAPEAVGGAEGSEGTEAGAPPKAGNGRKRRGRRGIPLETGRAVAVGRSAGG